MSVMSETDNFASDGKKFLDTYSYGYSNQVFTIQGPVAGNQKIRAFVASQRRVGSTPVFWDGFSFENGVDGINLTDTGDRGGRTHWTDTDGDGTVDPEVLSELNLKGGRIEHTEGQGYDFNGTLIFDYQPVKLQITGLFSDESLEFNPGPIRNMLNTARLP
ncbi:MAG: hypothetical protein O2782_23715, partial [bacterium]|nr:hypothetical protein [bacterium]